VEIGHLEFEIYYGNHDMVEVGAPPSHRPRLLPPLWFVMPNESVISTGVILGVLTVGFDGCDSMSDDDHGDGMKRTFASLEMATCGGLLSWNETEIQRKIYSMDFSIYYSEIYVMICASV